MGDSLKHVEILGALSLVCYGLGIFLGGAFLFIPNGWFLLAVTWGISFPGVVAGIGSSLRKWWSHPIAALASFPVLLFVPFGTALSIYTFCVISKPEVASYLSGETEE